MVEQKTTPRSNNFKDIAGQRFGRLTAIESVRRRGCGKAIWLCACDCGKRVEAIGTHLRIGRVRSCNSALCQSLPIPATRASDRPRISAERLREALYYDPNSGEFSWKQKTSIRSKVGKTAGLSCKADYQRISIDNRRYKAHHLAWLYMTGEWPNGIVDHKDGQKSNNRWDNLRIATPRENRANSPVNANNKCGRKGVHKVGRKWRALLQTTDERMHLGYFECLDSAAAAYEDAAEQKFGEFART